MNRYGTLILVTDYLEKKGTRVAHDFGVHYTCNVESNCTEAIKLRKMITEAGIDLAQLVTEVGEDYVKSRSSINPLELPSFLEITGRAVLNIAGQNIEVDLKEVVTQQLYSYFGSEIARFRENRDTISTLGRNLFRNYTAYIQEVRAMRQLPQSPVPAKELLDYNCTVARGDKRTWQFLFPFEYAPQWITIGDRRYKLCDEHIASLKKTGLVSMFQVTINNDLVPPTLYDRHLNKFYHYHGSSYDCWGRLLFPKIWDGKLKTLADLNYAAQAALATINRDSLMLNAPIGMISVPKLMDKATEEGEEGVVTKKKKRRRVETPAAEPTNTEGTTATFTNTNTPVHWGGGN